MRYIHITYILTYILEHCLAIKRMTLTISNNMDGCYAKGVIEGVMLDVMYEIPSLKNVEKCIVSGDTITKKEKVQLVFKQEKIAE